ncbi:MAG TPA: cytochrome b [Marinagarivorans sp.]
MKPTALTPPAPLGKLTINLHWIVAGAMIGLACAGVLMKYWEVWSLYPIHKSLGILAFVVIITRILWRLKSGWPTPARPYARREQIAAKVTHWVLLITTLLMPLSGMLASGASGHGFGLFGLTLVPTNHSLATPNEVIPYSEQWANIGYAIHTYAGIVLAAALSLHILGALKHHLLDRDQTLLRMLGRV